MNVCRICHEGRAAGKLRKPCKCSGTIAYVHKTCLEKWQNSSPRIDCEICLNTYKIFFLPESQLLMVYLTVTCLVTLLLVSISLLAYFIDNIPIIGHIFAGMGLFVFVCGNIYAIKTFCLWRRGRMSLDSFP